MKVSVNWIREIIKNDQCSADPMPKGINALVETIGAQLGAVEEVIDIGKKYQGVVVVKVVKCQKHPNADKLSLCLINDSGKVRDLKRDKDGYVQVIHGAKNVKVGQLVAWIPPGIAVPSTVGKDPFVLEAREIRGKVSNGMVASAKELALGDDHTGILIIDEPAKPGQPFAEVYKLDDFIIDIENKMFTHRPDCFGMLGIARELAGIQGMVFRSPTWYLGNKTTGNHRTDAQLLGAKNEIPKLVPRFMLQIVKNVKIAPSSMDIQSYLARLGIRPINNIVDITNYIMLETAQPIHAYDYDKVKALSSGPKAHVVVREAMKGEKLRLLGDKEVKLEGGEILIATNKQPIGLAGVMGGAETEVDDSTKNIILEVGTFDMNTTRKTAMTYGLFTDAATRFTKNQSPWQNDRVLARAVEFVTREGGGLPARSVYDLKSKLTPPAQVKTTAGFINDRLGLKLTPAHIKKLLENVEFKVEVKQEQPTTPQNSHFQGHFQGSTLEIEVPFWRTDIEIPEDIVEEVGRLYGYDHLPLELPVKDLTPAAHNEALDFKRRVRDILSAAGGSEVLTYSFIHSSLIDKAGQDAKDAYHIRNALSPDLQCYRLSLTPSLLEKVHPNIKEGFESFTLFEIGRAHVRGVVDEEKLPMELERLCLVVAKNKSRKEAGAPYFAAKKQLENLLHNIGIRSVKYVPLGEELDKQWNVAAKAYEPKRSAVIRYKEKTIGLIGEPAQKLRQALKLPGFTAQAEIDTSVLATNSQPLLYYPLNKFPPVEQDICLKTNIGVTYGELTDFVLNSLEKISGERGYNHWLSPVDIYQRPQNKNHKQTTWHIVLSHPEKTLTTAEANKVLDKIAVDAKAKFKAERI